MAGQSLDKGYFSPTLRLRLRDGLRDYVFLERGERVPEGYEPVPFFEGISARILRRLANNPFNLRVLRDMVYGDSLSHDTRDFAAERVIRQVAAWLSEGRLRLVQPSQPQYAVLAKKEAPPPPLVEETPTSWVGIELVDQDDKPVPGMRFRLKLPDGTYKDGLTDKTGRFRISGIAEGSCELELLSLDAADWEAA